jgi:tetratricopeptide (TPR) repeat protein
MKTDMRIGKLTNISAILVLSLFLVSCSKEKDTFTAKLYHNTTSFFNGYYNARALFRESVVQLEEEYAYEGQGFIDVVYYGTEDEIKNLQANFETIIKKNDVVMYKHPNGNWIDDCRLLNGKAWFYRQNYSLAMQNFDFVIDEYPQSKRMGETWFWVAQTFYMMDNREMARSVIEEEIVRADSFDLDKNLAAEIAVFRARLAIDDKAYKKAARLLEDHAGDLKNRQRRARARFLLGQLYTESGDFPRALAQYQQVEKLSLDYDLTFQAKMRVSDLYLEFHKEAGEEAEVVKYLEKLRKDEKNEEYLDQIYYQYALLELKKGPGHRDEAIEYLRASIGANLSNQRQKALSYFKIGSVYFYDLLDYPMAQAYYDSAASVVTKEAPEYEEITTVAATLKDYITYRNNIVYQDSMLRLSRLPEAELEALIDELVAEKKRQEEEEAERLLAQMQNNGGANNPFFNNTLAQNQARNNQGQGGGSQWYFDNPSAVSSGRLQFQQLWGQRKNEDHWRRSKKQNEGFGGAQEEEELAQNELSPEDSALMKQYGERFAYYQDIPKTEEEVAEAKRLIEEGHFMLGQIYGQKLNEPDSAIAAYERLLDRFEDTEYTLQARYALYQLYTEKGNPIANVHKSFILNEHPNSVYAYLIQGKDPRELKQDEREFMEIYTGLVSTYARGEYQSSLGFSEFILGQERFQNNPEVDLARLHFIRGMSYGYVGNLDSLRRILTHVVNTYPESEVTPRARETLGYLGEDPNAPPAPVEESTGQPAEEVKPANAEDPRFAGFTADVKPNDKIFVLMLVDKELISKADITARISDFNQKLYNDAKLKVFTFLYKQDYLLPYISNFESISDAAKYVKNCLAEPAVAQGLLDQPGVEVFYITHTNFKVAYGQKRMEDYIAFYQEVLTQ